MEQHTEDEKRATERSERRRANAEYYRKLGRCPVCGRKDAKTDAVGGMCFDCLEKSRANHQRYRDHRNAVGSANKKRLYEERKSAGVCVKCGKPCDRPGRTQCSTCATKDAKRHRDKRASQSEHRRGDEGYCYKCVNVPAAEGYKLCPSCLEKARAAWKLVPRPSKEHPWKKDWVFKQKKEGEK